MDKEGNRIRRITEDNRIFDNAYQKSLILLLILHHQLEKYHFNYLISKETNANQMMYYNGFWINIDQTEQQQQQQQPEQQKYWLYVILMHILVI